MVCKCLCSAALRSIILGSEKVIPPRVLIQSLFDYNSPFGRIGPSWALVHVIETEHILRLELVIEQDILCERDQGQR